MKRAMHWMLNGLTVLSLLMCVGTVGLWLLIGEGLVLRERRDPMANNSWLTSTHRGMLFVTEDGPLNYGGPLDSFSSTSTGYVLNPRGLLWRVRPRWRAYLLTTALFALTPTVVVGKKLFQRRCRSGACAKCHYDLTSNVSGVCPECGKAIVGEA